MNINAFFYFCLFILTEQDEYDSNQNGILVKVTVPTAIVNGRRSTEELKKIDELVEDVSDNGKG